MPLIRVTDLPAAGGTLDDDDEFLSLEDGSLRRATRAQAGPKASIVQVLDTANQFTATNVEDVLAEIQDNVDALVISGGGISVASEAETLAGTNNTKAITPARLTRAGKAALYDTFAGKSNGALPAADSGHVWNSSGTGPLVIIDGTLGNTSGTGYIDTPLGARGTRVGGRWVWTAAGSTDAGSATFLLWANQFAGNPFPPDSPVHFSVNPTTARFSVWENQVEEELWRTDFAERLATDGTTVHEVDIIVEGETATIRLPDGNVVTITDPRIGSLGGTIAGFECFHVLSATDHRPRFVDVWADTREITSRSSVPLGALYRAYKKAGEAGAATRLEYTSTGSHSWVVPDSATWADVVLVGGGGGGGSGRRGAAGTVRTGGGGGQAGGRTKGRIWLVPLRGSTLTIFVGSGGAGAAAVAADDTNGSASAAGSASWVQKSGGETLLWATHGAPGAGGTTTTALGGTTGGWGSALGGSGGASSATGGAGAAGLSSEGTLADAGGGGGAGGGITSADSASAGGAGYYQQPSVASAVNAGTAGTVNNAGGNATNASAAVLAAIDPPGGAGGGGGGASITGAAGAGGAGGKYGGGGGGGGASLNGGASGAGGAGGNGAVVLIVT